MVWGVTATQIRFARLKEAHINVKILLNYTVPRLKLWQDDALIAEIADMTHMSSTSKSEFFNAEGKTPEEIACWRLEL